MPALLLLTYGTAQRWRVDGTCPCNDLRGGECFLEVLLVLLLDQGLTIVACGKLYVTNPRMDLVKAIGNRHNSRRWQRVEPPINNVAFLQTGEPYRGE